MNILIPDRWLRQHLDTKATTTQIRECLSLCGPSIERINTVGKESVYDVEVTTNRVDMMSVRGIAREASVILPQFGIPARMIPIEIDNRVNESNKPLGISIENNPALCRRIIAVKLDGITDKKSPLEISEFLTLVGERPISAAVDVTNFVMYEIGHPLHAFDYDKLKEKRIVVRLARKGEHFTTLDGKKHTTLGGEIIFEDGKGTVIDLPAIMGCENTCVTKETKSILLWTESADPVAIRQASMGLSIRSQAAVINEKHPDPDLAMDAFKRALYLYEKILGAKTASSMKDIYPVKDKVSSISVSRERMCQFIGEEVPTKNISEILTNLGCSVTLNGKKEHAIISVTPPSWRRDDMTIGEDVIEEVARIFGYHRIKPVLPSTSAIPKSPEPILVWEKQIKSSLAGWGYTEMYTYSMLSQKQLELAGFDAKKTLKITNPLVSEHEFMRPSLLPSVIQAYATNSRIRDHLKLFELSNAYEYRNGILPLEKRLLVVVQSGQCFRELKGVAEMIFQHMGIPFPHDTTQSEYPLFDGNRSLKLGDFGSIGFIAPDYRKALGIETDILALGLNFDMLVAKQNYHISYSPIPKYPSIIEDLSFTVPVGFQCGPFLETLKKTDVHITALSLHDIYNDTRTIRVIYSDLTRNLTNEDIKPIREKLIKKAQESFSAILRV
jgi:phenylalanyl-tRNA synthetase beta chain